MIKFTVFVSKYPDFLIIVHNYIKTTIKVSLLELKPLFFDRLMAFIHPPLFSMKTKRLI